MHPLLEHSKNPYRQRRNLEAMAVVNVPISTDSPPTFRNKRGTLSYDEKI